MKFSHLWSRFVPVVLFLFICVIAAAFLSAKEKSSKETSVSSEAALQAQEVPQKPDKTEVTKEKPEKPLPRALSSRVVEYHISVRLDAENKQLNGDQTVTWTNPGYTPVKELYFHLYPNAFESKKTTFMKESGGKLRSDSAKDGGYGSMKITSIQTVNGKNLLPSSKFVQPDDGNANDHTLMKVSLDQPVQPREKVTLNLTFQVKLPKVFARMGYAGDFVMAGQWFPKISVYEQAGVRNRKTEGWNLHQYHGNSEFYADFGIYSVTIAVPQNYIVAATGFPTKTPVSQGKSKIYRFYADDVHDFAWAASPHFVYAEEPFSTKNIPGVKIKLYLEPLQKDLKDRYFAAVKKSLSDYADWYGEYPYSTLSVVVPPGNGNGAGGMEYPTLITGWGAKEAKPDLELERVLVHEIGHQYWYGMVASNEFEEAWLDEGFTSYVESKVMNKEYDTKTDLPLEASYVTDPAALNLNAWQYSRHSEYADNVYLRAKLVLTAIERKIGSDTMQRVLRAYFQQWKFKHPTTSDFLNVLNRVTGEEWGNYFNQFVFSGNMMDLRVEAIKVAKRKTDGRDQYVSTVQISNKGGWIKQDVPILLNFADGSSVVKHWDGNAKTIQYRMVSPAAVDWAMIDPNYSLVLENRHINNFLRTGIEDKWKVRWNLGIAKLIETLLQWVAL